MDDTTSQDAEETPVVDGEIVQSGPNESSQAKTGDDATILLSLESLIKNHIASIDTLKEELKKHKQSLEDSFMHDSVYQEHARLAKEAVKIKSATKSQITKQPQNMQLTSKIKSMTTELKDKNLSLSDYLLEYQRMTGANEIEGEDGEVREIVNSAKVIKKTPKK